MPLDRAESVLTDVSLGSLVDGVIRRSEGGYRIASARGSIDFRRDGDGFEITDRSGEPPVNDNLTDRPDADSEQADPWATLGRHATPYALDHTAQFLDSDQAPDLVILHTPSHRFHGNAGEHGSLGITQSRAPFIAAGPGIVPRGLVAEHLRMIDVAPTLAALLGCPPIDGLDGVGTKRSGVRLPVQDGTERHELLDTDERPDHVVVFLMDGTNNNALHAAVADGAAPSIAALIERGTSYRDGVIASLPTATLANHTTSMTGVHPGRTGILHNTWFDRGRDKTVDLLQLEEMMRACDHLRPDVETVHEALHRARPDARSVSAFEYADRGADWSTWAEFRAGHSLSSPDDKERRQHRHPEFGEIPKYRYMSVIDAQSVHHALRFWDGTNGEPPEFTFVNFSLTDEIGHYDGPHGDMTRAAITDTDSRIGQMLDAIEAAGKLDRTAAVVYADHGMQAMAEGQAVDLGSTLRGEGIAHRMLDAQYVYLVGDVVPRI